MVKMKLLYALIAYLRYFQYITKQNSVVAMSTTEAEYVAASQTIKDLIWIDCLRKELLQDGEVDVPVLMVDNQSAIKLIKDHQFHTST